MPQLSRKPHNDPHRKGWHVYFGDVQIGHIGERAGVPKDVEQWGWLLGFYPGTDRQYGGIGETFEECRTAFEAAWNQLRPTVTDDDFERWRHDRDSTAWKYRMWAKKLPLPTQRRDGLAHCFCGEPITNQSVPAHVRTAHRGLGADAAQPGRSGLDSGAKRPPPPSR